MPDHDIEQIIHQGYEQMRFARFERVLDNQFCFGAFILIGFEANEVSPYMKPLFHKVNISDFQCQQFTQSQSTE